MIRDGFRMKLKPGFAAEYKKRHDEIWPELVKVHSDAGIFDYTIYLDEETDDLFAFRRLTDNNTAGELRNDPLIKKWWAYNQQLMVSNPDGTPWVKVIKEVFHMD